MLGRAGEGSLPQGPILGWMLGLLGVRAEGLGEGCGVLAAYR